MGKHVAPPPSAQDGFFAVGIYQAKRFENVGVLWRGAYQLGAAYLFTIGKRYKPQASDTVDAWKSIPLFTYATFEIFMESLPYSVPLVGVEMGGESLPSFVHPPRALYLLGAEDGGLPNEVLRHCHRLVSIPALRYASFNVAQAGTLVMYDRMIKKGEPS